MPKERKTVTLDPDLVEWVEAQPDLNLSGLLNDLLRAHVEGGGTIDQVMEVRREQVMRRVEELEEQLSAARDELENYDSIVEEHRERVNEPVRRAVGLVQEQDSWRYLDPDNAAVEALSPESIDPDEFVERVLDELDGQTWEIRKDLKSARDKLVRFDAEAFRETGEPREALETVEFLDE